MIVAIYDIGDGKIERFAGCPPNEVEMNCMEGQDFYLNCPTEATHIIDGNPMTISASVDILISAIREQRNYKLMACDWTQASDSPLDVDKKTKWATYRQQLRGFPDVCDVNSPVWPVAPI